MRFPDPQRSRVIIIGTSTYQDEKLPDLPEISQSVTDLVGTLTDPVTGIVPADNCVVLADEKDLNVIGRGLTRSVMNAEDLLLVYYAGHGLIGGRRHDLYLALPDSEWAHPTTFNSLKYDDLRAAVMDSPAATKVVILDCCFSGRAVTDTMAGPEAEVVSQMEVDGSYVLTSAQRDQVALIVPGEKHTAFTGRLLKLLREGMPEGPEFLTIEDLYRELLTKMRAEGLSLPQRRGTDSAGMLPITRNHAFADTAIPLLRQRAEAAMEAGRNGDWEGAEGQLGDIVANLERIAGPQDEDTLRVRQMLAHTIGGAGRPLAAVAMLRALSPEQARVLGEDHADTLTSRQYLAVNLGEAGYRDQAAEMLRVLLPDRRRILGSDDPDTLRTAHMLARNLAAMGTTGEAIALLRELVAARERVLGAEHAHTIRARRDLMALLEHVR